MDEKSKKRFDELVATDPGAWSEADKAFLRARRSYLAQWQAESFAPVLAITDQSSESDEESTAAEAPKKKK